ncbi:NB-ARC domain protein [Pelomyxa schiedti]|nr:NB-ARC domain protein [Pelomyxa schiedti]
MISTVSQLAQDLSPQSESATAERYDALVKKLNVTPLPLPQQLPADPKSPNSNPQAPSTSTTGGGITPRTGSVSGGGIVSRIVGCAKSAADSLLEKLRADDRPGGTPDESDTGSGRIKRSLAYDNPRKRLALEVIAQFALTPTKTQALIEEVKQLAVVEDREVVQQLLDVLINTVEQDALVNVGMIDAVAYVLSEAPREHLAEDQAVKVLRVLANKASDMHAQSSNAERVFSVLCAINQDKQKIVSSFKEIKSAFSNYKQKECHVAAEAEVAKQNLLRIDDNSEILDSVAKWVGNGIKAIQGVVNVVNQWDVSLLLEAFGDIKHSIDEINEEQLLALSRVEQIFWKTKLHGKSVQDSAEAAGSASVPHSTSSSPPNISAAAKILDAGKRLIRSGYDLSKSILEGDHDFTLGYLNLLTGIVHSQPVEKNADLKQWCMQQMTKVLLDRNPLDDSYVRRLLNSEVGIRVFIISKLKEYLGFPEPINNIARAQLREVKQAMMLEEQGEARSLGVDIAIMNFSSGRQFEKAVPSLITEAKATPGGRRQGVLAFIESRDAWVYVNALDGIVFGFGEAYDNTYVDSGKATAWQNKVIATKSKFHSKTAISMRYLQSKLQACSSTFGSEALSQLSLRLEQFVNFIEEQQQEKEQRDRKSGKTTVQFKVHPIIHLKDLLPSDATAIQPTQFEAVEISGELLQKAKKELQKRLKGSVTEQIQEMKQRFFDDVEIEKQLKMYVELKGKYNETDETSFDLTSELFRKFLRLPVKNPSGLKSVSFNAEEDSPMPQTMLLLGCAGTGKSLFGRCLEKILWEQFDDLHVTPVFISLPAIKDARKKLIEKYLFDQGFTMENIEQLKNERHRLLLILDGFDEVNLEGGANFCRTNEFNKWNAQVLVTSRPEAIGPDWFDQFSFSRTKDSTEDVLCWYIEAFDEKKIADYVEKYRVNGGPLGSQCADLYNEYKKELEDVKELLKTPFVLTIFMEILPTLVEKYQHEEMERKLREETKKKPTLTRLELYDKFTDQWFQREKAKITPERFQACRTATDGSVMFNFQVKGDIVSDYKTFSQELAFMMLRQGSTMVRYTPKWRQNENKVNVLDVSNPLEIFFSCTNPCIELVRAGCPLQQKGNNFMFIHKTIMEYFIAQKICYDAILCAEHPYTNFYEVRQSATLRAAPEKKIQEFLEQLLLEMEKIQPFLNAGQKKIFVDEFLQIVNRGETLIDACHQAISNLNLSPSLKEAALSAKKQCTFPLFSLLKMRLCVREFLQKREARRTHVVIPPPHLQPLNLQPLRIQPEVVRFLSEILTNENAEKASQLFEGLVMFIRKSRLRTLGTFQDLCAQPPIPKKRGHTLTTGGPNVATAASNAMTVLARSNQTFVGWDFAGICIPEADLTCAVFDKCDFNHADLHGCDMQQTWLHNSNFTGCNLAGVNFGQAGIKFNVAGKELVLVDFSSSEQVIKTKVLAKSKPPYELGHFSPDSKFLLGVGADFVQVFDVATHTEILKREVVVELVTFSANFLTLQSSTNVYVIDAVTGVEYLKETLPKKSKYCFSSDSKFFAIKAKSTVTVWRTSNWQKACVFECVTGDDFEPPSIKYFVSVLDKTVHLYDYESGKKNLEKTCEDTITCSSGKNSFLALGLKNGAVYLFDLDNSSIRVLKGHSKDRLHDVTFSHDSSLLISYTSRSFSAWDIASGKMLWTSPFDEKAGSLAIDNKTLAVAHGKSVLLKDINFKSPRQSTVPHPHMGLGGVISPDGSRMISHGWSLKNKNVEVISYWDTETKEFLFSTTITTAMNMASFLTPDGSVLAAHFKKVKVEGEQSAPSVNPNSPTILQRWDTKTGEKLPPLQYPKQIRGSFKFTRDAQLAVVVESDGAAIGILDPKAGSICRFKLPEEAPKKTVTVGYFSMDNKLMNVLTLDNSRKERFMQVVDLVERRTLRSYRDCRDLIFSPTGDLIIFVSSKEFFIQECKGELPLELSKSSTFTLSEPFLDYSCIQGRLIVFECADNVLSIFDVINREFIAHIQFPDDFNGHVAQGEIVVVATDCCFYWFSVKLFRGVYKVSLTKRVPITTGSIPVMTAGAMFLSSHGLSPINKLFLKQQGAQLEASSTKTELTHVAHYQGLDFGFHSAKGSSPHTFIEQGDVRDKALFSLLSQCGDLDLRKIVSLEIKSAALFHPGSCKLLPHWSQVRKARKNYLNAWDAFKTQAKGFIKGENLGELDSPKDLLSRIPESLDSSKALHELYQTDIEPYEQVIEEWCILQDVFCTYVEGFFSWHNKPMLNIIPNSNVSRLVGVVDALCKVLHLPGIYIWTTNEAASTDSPIPIQALHCCGDVKEVLLHIVIHDSGEATNTEFIQYVGLVSEIQEQTLNNIEDEESSSSEEEDDWDVDDDYYEESDSDDESEEAQEDAGDKDECANSSKAAAGEGKTKAKEEEEEEEGDEEEEEGEEQAEEDEEGEEEGKKDEETGKERQALPNTNVEAQPKPATSTHSTHEALSRVVGKITAPIATPVPDASFAQIVNKAVIKPGWKIAVKPNPQTPPVTHKVLDRTSTSPSPERKSSAPPDNTSSTDPKPNVVVTNPRASAPVPRDELFSNDLLRGSGSIVAQALGVPNKDGKPSKEPKTKSKFPSLRRGKKTDADAKTEKPTAPQKPTTTTKPTTTNTNTQTKLKPTTPSSSSDENEDTSDEDDTL